LIDHKILHRNEQKLQKKNSFTIRFTVYKAIYKAILIFYAILAEIIYP